jgi:6-phosphogluconolactonase
MISPPELVIVSDRSALARAAAERFVSLARQSIEARGRFVAALSGGSTPRELYALLATPEFANQVDLAHVHFFWGEERAVPPDHADSNFKMANDALFSRVPVPPPNVHRIHGELPPNDAAREYEQTLRQFFQLDADERGQTQAKENPRSSAREAVRVASFDLILLGLGANGHTASLFPHTQVLRETSCWVAAEYIAEVKMDRITLTVPIINAAANILWLVAGEDKAQIIRQVLHGEYRPDDLPAQLIQPAKGSMTWLLDANAAAQLKN